MSWLRALLICASAAMPAALSLWLFFQIARARYVSKRGVLLTGIFGAAAALLATSLELSFLAWTDISLDASRGNALSAALATLLVLAPLGEGLKMAVVWPSYLRGRLHSGRVGVLYAVAAASGFAGARTLVAYFAGDAQTWLDVLRAVIALPAHLFFASLWGYALARGGQRVLPWLWLGVSLIHGGYDHVVFGRGPALLVVVVPVLILMVIGTWMLLRDEGKVALSEEGRRSRFEPPSVRRVRQVMRATGQPLMLRWIVFGAFVTLGVTLVFLAAAVYVGHRYGVDFAQVDETDLLATVPLVLLGTALLAAFPVSGYLVARASGARSVLEPAWATGVAMVLTLGMFSVTEPMALVVAASVAPVGFALGCVGAWFGLDRST